MCVSYFLCGSVYFAAICLCKRPLILEDFFLNIITFMFEDIFSNLKVFFCFLKKNIYISTYQSKKKAKYF